ncbi:MAG: hypothetical protein EOO46_15980 [Flavobacterium sp.]|nr:MAG: hypothetical protein EOO46_15980 [Flavobacterium sp.]
MLKGSHSQVPRFISIVLLSVVAFNALAAGYSFITDPSGEGLGITTTYLKSSAPFDDYFVPGILLFFVNGVLSLVIAGLTIAKQRHYPLFIFLQGGILIGWIGVQLTMIVSFHLLHFNVASIGFILIICGRMLKQRKKA